MPLEGSVKTRSLYSAFQIRSALDVGHSECEKIPGLIECEKFPALAVELVLLEIPIKTRLLSTETHKFRSAIMGSAATCNVPNLVTYSLLATAMFVESA